jgi:CubicO group peptidase (beta-lactamase class C family)
METSGLSKAGLSRMHDVMSGYVQRGEVPGLITAVVRRGEVFIDAIGVREVGGPPVEPDTIFRISSLTKPITAVAAMLCVEECALRLDEPVDRLLPELADRTVLRRLDSPLDDTVPAKRPITVRDLLTFRMGTGMIIAPPDQFPIQRAMTELCLGQGAPNPSLPPSPDEWIRRLGMLPLVQQPGAGWMYNTGSDVLGVLIARASGQPFDAFLRDRILGPLGMSDTAFSVPAAKLGRLATGYADGPQAGAFNVYDAGGTASQWSSPPRFPSGAGGLVSTVADYIAFGQMMVRYGKHQGGRILSRPSVELMTADQLAPGQKANSGAFAGYFDNHGWGLGMSVSTRRDDIGEPVGRFGWNGGLGSVWYADPREDLVTILMTGCAKVTLSPPAIYRDFWTLAYQAIDD